MTKLVLLMIEFTILIILEVHANDSTPLSSAPIPLPISFHPFQLDNYEMTHIHFCLERTLEVCGDIPKLVKHKNVCIVSILFECLFMNPMHHRDIHGGNEIIKTKCKRLCVKERKFRGLLLLPCLVTCYEDNIKKD
jgi:hypothetical protein